MINHDTVNLRVLFFKSVKINIKIKKHIEQKERNTPPTATQPPTTTAQCCARGAGAAAFTATGTQPGGRLYELWFVYNIIIQIHTVSYVKYQSW